jgi:hypothetical protein
MDDLDIIRYECSSYGDRCVADDGLRGLLISYFRCVYRIINTTISVRSEYLATSCLLENTENLDKLEIRILFFYQDNKIN